MNTLIGNKAKINILLVLFGLLFAATLSLSGSMAQAAGIATISVELNDTVTTDTDFVASFYVTASDSDLFSVNTTVNLSNLTFRSFSPIGTSFSGFSGVTSGSDLGSTSFELTASYQGSTACSGKLLIGQAILRSSETAGNGQVDFADNIALDKKIQQIAANAESESVIITAGTSTEGNHMPDAGNQVVIPSDQIGCDMPAEVVSTNTLAAALTEEESRNAPTDDAATSNELSTGRTVLAAAIGIGAAALVLALIFPRSRHAITGRLRRLRPNHKHSTAHHQDSTSVNTVQPDNQHEHKEE